MSAPTPAAPARPPVRRPWARRILQVISGICLLALLGVVIGTGWLQSAPGNRWILSQILPFAQPAEGSLEIDALRTDLFSEIGLSGLRVRDGAGRVLLEVPTVAAKLRLGSLPALLVIEDLQARGLRADLRQGPEGLDIVKIWGPGTPSSEPFSFPLEIRLEGAELWAEELAVAGEGWASSARDVELTGGLRAWKRSVELTGVRLRSGEVRAPTGEAAPVPIGAAEVLFTGSVADMRALQILHGRVAVLGQELEVVGTVGEVGTTGVLDLAIPSLKFRPARLCQPDGSPLPGIPVLPVDAPVDASGTVKGDYQHPAFNILFGTAGGSAALEGAVDLAQQTWTASLHTASLRPALLGPSLPTVEVGGAVTASGDLSGARLQAEAGLWVEGVEGLGRAELESRARLEDGTLWLDALTLGAGNLQLALSGSVDQAGEARLEVTRLRLPLARIREVPRMLRSVPGLAEQLAPQLAPLNGLDLGGTLEWSGQIAHAGVEWTAAGDLMLEGFRYQDRIAAAALGGPVEVRYGPGIARINMASPGSGAATRPEWADDLLLQTALEGEGLFLAAGERPCRADRASAELSLTPEGGSWAIGLLSYGTETRELLGTSGRWERRSGMLSVDRLDGDIPGVPAFSGTMTVVLRGQDRESFQARDLDLSLRVGEGALTVRGSAGMSGPLDLNIEASHLQPSQFRELADLTGWAGTLGLSVRARGTIQNPRVEGRAQIQGLDVPGAVHGLDLDATLEGGREGWALHVAAEDGLFQLSAALPVRLEELLQEGTTGAGWLDPQGEIALSATLAPTGMEALRRLIAVELPEMPAKMQLSAAAQLSGPAADPVGQIVITTRAGLGPDQERLQLDLDLGMKDGRLSVDGTIWEHLLPRGVLRGSAPFDSRTIAARLLAGEPPTRDQLLAAVGPLDLDLTARKVPLRTFDPWLPLQGKLSGSLVGNLHLGGSLQDPDVRGTWLLDEARVARVPISRALLTLADRDDKEGGLSIGLDAAFGEIDGQQTGLTVVADIPISINLLALPSGEELMDRPGLEIRIGGAGVPLRLAEVAVPGMRVERGLIQVAGTIRGSLAKLVPELSVGLVDGRLSLDSTGVTYEDVNVQAALADHTFALTTFSMESADSVDLGLPGENLLPASRFSGALEVALAPDWTPLSATGGFDFEGFHLSALPDRQIRISGSTKLSGANGKIALRGGLRVDRALMRLREDFFVADTSTELHPDIHLIGVESDDTREPSGLEGLLAVVPQWLKVALDIDLTETLYVAVSMPLEDRFGAVGRDFSTVNVEGTIGGKLRAELDHDKLIVLGELEPERGQVRVLGKTFQIQQGTIAFTGRDVLTPLLDLTATYPTRDYGPMMLKIAGTPDNPTITFTSDSYSEDDVMAILLTGSPASGGGDALGQLLTSAVLGIAQEGLGSVGGAGVVESVQLDTLGVQGGFRITRNVSLYTRYNFANNLTKDPAFVEITLEWALPDDWSMEVQSGLGASVSAWHTWKF